jgi:hypothetical protein
MLVLLADCGEEGNLVLPSEPVTLTFARTMDIVRDGRDAMLTTAADTHFGGSFYAWRGMPFNEDETDGLNRLLQRMSFLAPHTYVPPGALEAFASPGLFAPGAARCRL